MWEGTPLKYWNSGKNIGQVSDVKYFFGIVIDSSLYLWFVVCSIGTLSLMMIEIDFKDIFEQDFDTKCQKN